MAKAIVSRYGSIASTYSPPLPSSPRANTAAQQDKPYGYGIVGPDGLPALAKCPQKVLNGRPSFRDGQSRERRSKAIAASQGLILLMLLTIDA
jgi:hypothetical protein